VLLTRPLWQRARGAAPADVSGVPALRQQLEQLAALKQSGVLGHEAYDDARQALERRIVNAVVNAPQATRAASSSPSKPLLFGMASFVCAVAVAGYAWLGTPKALSGELAAAAPAPTDATGKGHEVTLAQIEGMIDKLVARLKDKPQDPDGWAMLGRSYAMLGRHEQAAPALKQAVALRGNDPLLLADYADALAMVNGRSLDGEPNRLVEQALKIDPNLLKALSLAGTYAFNHQDYKGALKHWEKMLTLAPDTEMAKQIQSDIDEARKLAGGGGAMVADKRAPDKPAVAAGASLSGTVTLAPALAAKANPDDTLFVFARAAEGPRMPLAILRKQVKDLPLTFTLDDSMAMTPATKLSSASRVVVGARISARGDATPQPGDLQGFSAPVSPGATGLKIQIADVVATP
jgi:cytochrome c-type biogenesis protein CcmH